MEIISNLKIFVSLTGLTGFKMIISTEKTYLFSFYSKIATL